MSVAFTDLRRTFGFWSGVGLLVGSVIGGGIFRTPASIAAVLPDPPLIIGLWVFFGLISICGALTLSELATMLPRTGGVYVYLRAAYGDAAAFVFGWLYLLAAIPSGLAALAVFFGELVMRFVGRDLAASHWGIPGVAAATIILLSTANILSGRFGAGIQNTFAALKVVTLLALIGMALWSGLGDVSHWLAAPARDSTLGDLAAATKSVMFTYNGWVYVSLVAGEFYQPERRLSRIILAGTGTVMLLYVSVNLAYLYLVPVKAMPGTVVAQEVLKLIMGPVGGTLMGACILASVFGALNGGILAKSRVAYALSRDGLSFGFLGRAHPRSATPHVSIMIQGAIAIILIVALRDPVHPLRLFDRLSAYFVVVEWLALLFAIGAVFVLRRTMAELPRPYRTPGYPYVPIIFIAGTVLGLGAVIGSACSRADYSPLFGLGIVAAGFPVYRIWRSRADRPPAGIR